MAQVPTQEVREMRDQRAQAGQGLVEFGLALVVVAVAVIAALVLVGGQLSAVLNDVVTAIANALG